MPARAEKPLTLAQALREAQAANAQLPIARSGQAIARSRQAEAKAARWPVLGAEGDTRFGRPPAYSDEEVQFHLTGHVPLYQGGKLSADIRAAGAEVAGANARYRMAEKDLALAVRLRFFELAELDAEQAIDQDGIDQLQRYLGELQGRQASGQDVAADLLRTRVRLAQQQAALASAREKRAEARVALDDLMGRDPSRPIVLAPLPAPPPPPAPKPKPWQALPALAASRAEQAGAQARLRSVLSERLPHLSLDVEAGAIEPFWGATNLGPTANGEGLGYSLTLNASWRLWDFGGMQARAQSARLTVTRTGQEALATSRAVRRAWAKSRAQAAGFYRELAIQKKTVPTAKAAYLQAESRYLGGVGGSLEVIDAFSAWMEARAAAAQSTLAYRAALARLRRWGTP